MSAGDRAGEPEWEGIPPEGKKVDAHNTTGIPKRSIEKRTELISTASFFSCVHPHGKDSFTM